MSDEPYAWLTRQGAVPTFVNGCGDNDTALGAPDAAVDTPSKLLFCFQRAGEPPLTRQALEAAGFTFIDETDVNAHNRARSALVDVGLGGARIMAVCLAPDGCMTIQLEEPSGDSRPLWMDTISESTGRIE
jgi:hypothetical protein